jgi:hypothetical protein
MSKLHVVPKGPNPLSSNLRELADSIDSGAVPIDTVVILGLKSSEYEFFQLAGAYVNDTVLIGALEIGKVEIINAAHD